MHSKLYKNVSVIEQLKELCRINDILKIRRPTENKRGFNFK